MNPKWRGCKDGVRYSAHLDGIKFEYFANTGNKETSGGGSLLPRHFFKPRWQALFKEVFGKRVFSEICKAIDEEYARFKQNPENYRRKPNRPK